MSEYWDNFYAKGEAPKYPSDFCRFFMGLNIPGNSCVDLGCGNGRDTRVLGKRYLTVGIDPSTREKDEGHASYIASGVIDSLDLIKEADIVYSRFFLHSIDDKTINSILKATKGYFAAETRIEGDEPKLYPDHERNQIDPLKLIKKAMQADFELVYYRQGYGMARYMEEDPLVARIILRKKT